MRSSSDSKSSQPSRAITISPSSTKRASAPPTASSRLDQLREVSVQRFQVPRLQVELLAVAEDEGPEAIPLGLVAPPVADGQLGRGLGQHRFDGRRNREGHRRPMIRGAIGHTPARHGDQTSVPGCRGHRHRLAVPGSHRERRRAGGLRHVPGLAGGGEPQPDPVRLRGGRVGRAAAHARPPRPLRSHSGAGAGGLSRADRHHLGHRRPLRDRAARRGQAAGRGRSPMAPQASRSRRQPPTPTCSRRRRQPKRRQRTTRRCRSGSARPRRRA